MPDNTSFIVAAYTVTWVVLLGYLLHLRRARLEAERRVQQATQELSGGRT